MTAARQTTPPPQVAVGRTRRLQAAYELAGRVVVRRHDGEMRSVATRLLAGETVDGVSLGTHLRRISARRRSPAARST